MAEEGATAHPSCLRPWPATLAQAPLPAPCSRLVSQPTAPAP